MVAKCRSKQEVTELYETNENLGSKFKKEGQNAKSTLAVSRRVCQKRMRGRERERSKEVSDLHGK